MRGKKGVILVSTVAIVFSITTIILILAEIAIIMNDINKKTINNENNIIINETVENQQEESVSQTGINKWIGKYENEDTTIEITREDEDQLNVSIIKTSMGENINVSNKSFSVTANDDTNRITHQDDIFNEKYSVTITYTDDGIAIKASSNLEDSILNDINGSYKRKQFTSSGWNGLYENGTTKICISEVDKNEISMSITQGYSIYVIKFSDYTKQKIEYNDTSFGEEENIKITKTTQGIKVNANTTEEDALLNKISGEYVKK